MKNLYYLPMDIPNIDGYKLIGVDNDTNEFNCTVKLNKQYYYSVYRDDTQEPCFMSLAGWKKIENSQGDSK